MNYAGLFAALGSLLVVILVMYVLLIIANWKIFTKAGEAGWASLVPIYNGYVLFKISWDVKYFWIMLVLAVIEGIGQSIGDTAGNIITIVSGIPIIVLTFMQVNKLSKAFGHGTGFTLGMIFLPNIFSLILGFGGDQYLGPQ